MMTHVRHIEAFRLTKPRGYLGAELHSEGAYFPYRGP